MRNRGKVEKMSDKAEAAVGCFREGFSCSQAILSIYGPEFGLARETALKAGAALGAGMGRLGEACGAVTGAMIVIGLKYGHTEAKDKETKTKTYDRVRDYGERFRALHGSLLCRELLGCDLGTAEGMETARQKGYFTELCPRFVREAAEILEDVL
jgi:C_GCAxxG_C_C family probable redox protein